MADEFHCTACGESIIPVRYEGDDISPEREIYYCPLCFEAWDITPPPPEKPWDRRFRIAREFFEENTNFIPVQRLVVFMVILWAMSILTEKLLAMDLDNGVADIVKTTFTGLAILVVILVFWEIIRRIVRFRRWLARKRKALHFNEEA